MAATSSTVFCFASVNLLKNSRCSPQVGNRNQFIKVLSVFLGCFCTIKDKGGLIKGALIGCACAVVTYLLFSLIGAEVSFGTTFFVDLIFQVVIGVIFGILAVNFRK